MGVKITKTISPKRLKTALTLLAISLIPTLLIWLPFFLRMETFWTIPLPQDGMATIVSNYDGPLFIVVAKTLYSIEAIKDQFQFPLPTEYYAAHYPMFPLLIKLFSPILGYPYSMIFVSLASSVLSIYFFHKLISVYIKRDNALWLTLAFSIFPARWLIVRSVGSSEPLFMAAVIASVYYFRKNKYWFAGLWGVVAQLTRSPGILLFIAYLGAIFVPSFKVYATKGVRKWYGYINLRKTYPIFLIPLALVSLFVFYGIRFGDFFAYFNSGDNIHLFFPPFQVFNYSAPWVGTFWLEEVIYIYLFGTLGLLSLLKQKEYVMAWVVGIFLISLFFVSHRDVARYGLAMLPFLYVTWRKFLVKREFKIALAVIAIPIYLYSITYISQNVMPISNWAPFL